jgi:hypothetical protein
MGKATENERIKLRATWFNNISVGLLIAGFIVPYLSTVFPNATEIGQFLEDWLGGKLTSPDVLKFILLVAPFVVAFGAGVAFRVGAGQEIRKFQD